MANDPSGEAGGFGSADADDASGKANAAMDSTKASAGSNSEKGKSGVDADKAAEKAVSPGGAPGGGEAGLPGVSQVSAAPLAGGGAAGGGASGGDMGVGGTSDGDGSGGAGDDDEFGAKEGLGNGMKMAPAAIPAAGAAGQLMVLMTFLNWLKGMAMMLMALAMNMWNLIVGAIVAVAKAVVGFFMGIGAGIASAVGGAISATAGAVVAGAMTFVMLVAGGSGLAASSNAEVELAQKDGLMVNCAADSEQQLVSINAPSDGGEDSYKNAEKVYSIMAGFGMPDENVAGILGNWDAESRIDPTSVEGIFDEPFHIGPRKQAAEDSGFSHMAYLNGDPSGIGLGQWTRGRNVNLRSYADAHDVDWFSLEAQMGFMISADEGSDANVVKDMIKNSKGSPGAAAVFFHDKWERSADTSMGVRKANANRWMGLMSGWDADEELADSILEQSGSSVDESEEVRASAVLDECRSADGMDPVMAEGGMDHDDAQAIIDLYLKEGDTFLKGRYGSGGPGACNGDKAMNCVSFSTYFVNKYTSFQQYAPGNGIDTAGSMASMMGKKTTSTPKAYSVASGPGTGPAGHTFIVLAVNGDTILGGEAGYCSTHGRLREMDISELRGWEFLDINDIMLDKDDIHES